MKVYTFLATDPDCPVQAIARIWGPLPGKGKMVNDFHPIFFGSISAASAEQRAVEWWNETQAKEKAKLAAVEARNAARMKKAEPKASEPAPEPVDDIGDVI